MADDAISFWETIISACIGWFESILSKVELLDEYFVMLFIFFTFKFFIFPLLAGPGPESDLSTRQKELARERRRSKGRRKP